MATRESRGRGIRAAVRDLVDRALRRNGLVPSHTARPANTHWEPDDHLEVIAVDQTPADPWEGEEPQIAPVDLVEVSGHRAPYEEWRGDTPDSECPKPVQRNSALPCEGDQPPFGLDPCAAEEPVDAVETAPTGKPLEPEDWSDLEESESGPVDAVGELRAAADREAKAYTFCVDEEQVGRPGSAFEGPDADFDYNRSKIDTLIDDFDFDDSDENANSWAEAPSEGFVDYRHDIEDFDPNARQAPWDSEPVLDEVVPRRARERAAAIAALIDLADRSQQRRLLSFLIDLFEHLQHPATFRALHRLASAGLTPELLQAVVEIRRQWMKRPDWWKGRYDSDFAISQLQHGATALGWSQAGRICRARPDYPVEAMIDEEWFEEWLLLSPGEPGFLSFPAYIDVKVATLEATLLDFGLLQEGRSNGYSEAGDDFGWYRHVAGDDGTIRFGFHTTTPYDERAGQIRMLDE